MKNLKFYLIIPTYNEKENIVPLIRAIVRVTRISRINKLNLNIIIVDDNSPDETAQAVLDLRFKNKDLRKKVTVILRPKKEGLGKSYLEGFRVALKKGADFVFSMDADFSHRPEDLRRFFGEPFELDLILGSRWVKEGSAQYGLFRQLLSKLANFFVRWGLGIKNKDATSGFRRYSRRFLESVIHQKFVSKNYFFLVEMVYYATKGGFQIKEIPIIFPDRKRGVTKMSIFEMYNSMRDFLKLYLISKKQKESVFQKPSQEQLKSILSRVPVDYYEKGNFIQKIWHNLRLKKALKILKNISPKTVLDVGCAGGLMTSQFKMRFPETKFWGIDLYRPAIEYASKKYPKIRFKTAAAEKLPFKNQTFDVIICFDTLEHLIEPKIFLTEVKRVLKPKGILIVGLALENWLFRFIWYFWSKGRGKVWDGAHFQHYASPKPIIKLVKAANFKLCQLEKSHLGMYLVMKLKNDYYSEEGHNV